MDTIDIFLKSFTKTYRDKNITLIPRWSSVRDEKFPAYYRYTLEVVELFSGEITYRFKVQTMENMTENAALSKEEKETMIKQKIAGQMIEIILKYYMYGESVQ